MKQFFKNYIGKNLPFWIFSTVAIIMLIVSWVTPPPWEIHSSVLEGVAEIFAFASLYTIIHAIDSGGTAKLKHKDTEIEVSKPNDDN